MGHNDVHGGGGGGWLVGWQCSGGFCMVCRWRWVVSVLVFGPGNGVGWSWGVVMDVWGRDD